MKCIKIVSSIVISLFIIFSHCYVFAEPPQSFTEAKRHASEIFSKNRTTIYCGCKYDKHRLINLKSCDMTHPKKNIKSKMEWEHIMPMSTITKQKPCSYNKVCKKKNGEAYGGRKCCRKVSKEYRKIEVELFNIWPSVDFVNRAKSDFKFAENILNDSTFYGCKVLINKDHKTISPSNEVKGLVARAHLFMSEKHGVKLSKQQEKLFLSWNSLFPPSDIEKSWEKQVSQIEGYHNTFISEWENLSLLFFHNLYPPPNHK